jgi:hypothetical protein
MALTKEEISKEYLKEGVLEVVAKLGLLKKELEENKASLEDYRKWYDRELTQKSDLITALEKKQEEIEAIKSLATVEKEDIYLELRKLVEASKGKNYEPTRTAKRLEELLNIWNKK